MSLVHCSTVLRKETLHILKDTHVINGLLTRYLQSGFHGWLIQSGFHGGLILDISNHIGIPAFLVSIWKYTKINLE